MYTTKDLGQRSSEAPKGRKQQREYLKPDSKLYFKKCNKQKYTFQIFV